MNRGCPACGVRVLNSGEPACISQAYAAVTTATVQSCAWRHCGVATHRAPSVPFQARKAHLSTGKEAAN